jgi:hypothetical protein
VSGSNFVGSSVVQWNETNLNTTYVSPTVLTARVSSALLGSIGTAQVRVFNAGPGGGASKALPLVVSGPTMAAGGLVNGASYSSQLSAGSYAALFGANLASVTVSARSIPLPTSLGSVSVLINGYAAPLFFVSPSQINLQVPWELSGTPEVEIIVTTNGFSATPIRATLAGQHPR